MCPIERLPKETFGFRGILQPFISRPASFPLKPYACLRMLIDFFFLAGLLWLLSMFDGDCSTLSNEERGTRGQPGLSEGWITFPTGKEAAMFGAWKTKNDNSRTR